MIDETADSAPIPSVPTLSNTNSDPLLKLDEEETTSIDSILPDLMSWL